MQRNLFNSNGTQRQKDLKRFNLHPINYKAVYQYHGLLFNADKVRQYMKRRARTDFSYKQPGC